MKAKIHKDIIKKVLVNRELKEGKVCTYCNCDNPITLTVDHIIPTVRGGSDDKWNKQVVCLICNFLKGPLTDEEFRKYLSALKDLHSLCKVKLMINPIFKYRLDFYPLQEKDGFGSEDKGAERV